MLYILIYNIHNFVYISLFLYQRINIFINIFYLRNCENSYKSIAEKVKENALDSFAIVCYRYIAKKNHKAGLRADTLRAFLCPLAKNARNGLQSVYPPEVSGSREAPGVCLCGDS